MDLRVVKACLGHCLATGQGEPFLRRLDPATRAKVLAALAGLIILGFGMVLLTWLGGRAVRRYMRGRPSEPRRTHGSSRDDWAERPLVRDRDEPGPDPTDP
ncbi:MAG: hypothetical protein ACC628_07710 [Pirellulaceae bacterium]